MADPLSVVATIFGLVGAGARLSTSLYDICETIGSAQEEVEEIAGDLSFFVVVVDELGKVFAAPKRIYSDKLESSVRDILKRCRHVFRKINRMIDRTAGLPKLKLQSKVMWVFRKGKVLEVKANLESLKSTLSLILQTLKLVQQQRQDDEEERQVLGNLLRSHTHSIKALKDIEKNQEIRRRHHQLSSSETQQDLPVTPIVTTAELLSEVVPSLPPKEILTSKPSESSDATKRGYGPIMQSSHFEKSLGTFYPIWKKSILERVSLLLTQWTLPPSPDPIRPQTNGDSTKPSTNSSHDSIDYEYEKEKKILNDQRSDLDQLQIELEQSQCVLRAQIQKIQDRLKKRDKGWLEIDDRALKRLMDELEVSSYKLEAGEVQRATYASRCSDLEIASAALYKSVAAETERKINYRQYPKTTLSSESQYDIPPGELHPWPSVLYGNREEDDSLTDTDTNSDSESHTTKHSAQSEIPFNLSAELPGDDSMPKSRSSFCDPHILTSSHSVHCDLPHPPPSAAGMPCNHPTTKPRSTSYGATTFKSSQTFATGPSDRPHPDMAATALPNDVIPNVIVNTCQRQAWKPPQPFAEGYNTFSYVLGAAMHSCLWFKASQDAYKFYLGGQEPNFYTIHLIPEDLSTFETSRVEWTAIEKPWATVKTLHAIGLQYFEDSLGFMWIHKDLSWHEIQQLFNFSCGLLDNAVNMSARHILLKRSEDVKKIERSFLSLRREEKKTWSQSFQEQHQVFFHADEPKRSEYSRFLRSSS